MHFINNILFLFKHSLNSMANDVKERSIPGIVERFSSEIDSLKKKDIKYEGRISSLKLQTYNLTQLYNYNSNPKCSLLDLPKARKDLRIVQLANIALLQNLKKICDENSLKFFLLGGSLLGAARHHGFIPWDDDLDIGMTRSDYKKLCDIISNSKEFYIDRDVNIYGKLPRFRDKKYKISCFIDIYPHDFFNANFKGIDEIYTACINERKRALDDLKEFRNAGGRKPSRKEIIKRYENLYMDFIKAYQNTEQATHIMRSVDVRYGQHRDKSKSLLVYTYSFEDIFPFAELEFEGRLYNVPHQYQKHLSDYFGDWQKIVFHPQHNVRSRIDIARMKDFLKSQNITYSWRLY